ncbi:16S rRNA (guanine(527)-N(7))-methyltransferase RsmG [Pelagibacteraceae bacterium]|nr:16S rRNA (guanine(527)-N(7))-methyltransferase RsmG [Pelagibacteraceae bacterium]|tara:strand:- start:279 stop:896 length:618 start_codon:yes stop_codon:yes gene_type:complete
MNRVEVQSSLIQDLEFTKKDVIKLASFHDELLRYNKKYNLISKSTETNIWDRHILDSAQLVKYIKFENNMSLSDMGSGAGFPGLVLAIFNKNPRFHVKLYEKSSIKCDFLENIKNKLDISCEINGSYQDWEINSDYIVSRAFKQLNEIIRISREIIKVNHKLIVLKGKNAEKEINKLQQPLEFMYKLEKSITDNDSKILIVDVKK